MRRRTLSILVGIAFFGVLAATGAWAGHPHFVSCSVTQNPDGTLTVDGKEAGLGDEEQIDIQVTATASCINPGSKHPKAANKVSLSETSTEPVQNGQAEFSITLDATGAFQPDCTPPMTVVFSDITVKDLTNNISCTL